MIFRPVVLLELDSRGQVNKAKLGRAQLSKNGSIIRLFLGVSSRIAHPGLTIKNELSRVWQNLAWVFMEQKKFIMGKRLMPELVLELGAKIEKDRKYALLNNLGGCAPLEMAIVAGEIEKPY